MTGQYVFSATPPAENPEVDRRFHEYTRTGTVRSWDDYLEARQMKGPGRTHRRTRYQLRGWRRPRKGHAQ